MNVYNIHCMYIGATCHSLYVSMKIIFTNGQYLQTTIYNSPIGLVYQTQFLIFRLLLRSPAVICDMAPPGRMWN